MPLGSSSEAPVIRPGPRMRRKLRFAATRSPAIRSVTGSSFIAAPALRSPVHLDETPPRTDRFRSRARHGQSPMAQHPMALPKMPTPRGENRAASGSDLGNEVRRQAETGRRGRQARRRGPEPLEAAQRGVGALADPRSVSAALGQHLGMALMHLGQPVAQRLIPFSVRRTWIERRSCSERSCAR